MSVPMTPPIVFADWLRSNMPPDTIISDPDWWAMAIWSAARRAINAAPVAPGGKASLPGWKLVPVEPTYIMVQAGAKLVKNNFPVHTGTLDIYKAMLAAAPEPPR